MSKTHPKKTLYTAYRFRGFTPEQEVKGLFGDRTALVIRLTRRSKKRHAGPAAPFTGAGTIDGRGTSEISHAAIAAFISRWTSGASSAGSVTA